MAGSKAMADWLKPQDSPLRLRKNQSVENAVVYIKPFSLSSVSPCVSVMHITCASIRRYFAYELSTLRVFK